MVVVGGPVVSATFLWSQALGCFPDCGLLVIFGLLSLSKNCLDLRIEACRDKGPLCYSP